MERRVNKGRIVRIIWSTGGDSGSVNINLIYERNFWLFQDSYSSLLASDFAAECFKNGCLMRTI